MPDRTNRLHRCESEDTDDEEIIRILSGSSFNNQETSTRPKNPVTPGGYETDDTVVDEEVVEILRVPPTPFIQDNSCRPSNPLICYFVLIELVEGLYAAGLRSSWLELVLESFSCTS